MNGYVLGTIFAIGAEILSRPDPSPRSSSSDYKSDNSSSLDQSCYMKNQHKFGNSICGKCSNTGKTICCGYNPNADINPWVCGWGGVGDTMQTAVEGTCGCR